MKRTIAIIVLAVVAGLGLLAAQSLVDNSYYQRSQELRGLADQAFTDGDYDAAADYAAQAREYASLSDQFVQKMVAMDAADRAMAAAKDRVAWAETVKAPSNWPREYAAARTELDAAQAAYGAEDFAGARSHADGVIAVLASVTEGLPLPATYTVRLIDREGQGPPRRTRRLDQAGEHRLRLSGSQLFLAALQESHGQDTLVLPQWPGRGT